ncbi:hypothetical protein [Lentibacillus halodurans]|uniref:hypothetical protein n=1 Tax=Lentibacillus halodurans TaxID=237679 RepID=UPI001FCD5FD6|nr:hypothetical protein [Lentibacillus halodurans]
MHDYGRSSPQCKRIWGKTKAEYTSLLDADLEAEQVFSLSDFRAPGKTFMEMMYDHEIHHKAQIFVCACMIGVKHVPFFR